jgi:MoxR-like ATPase
VQLNLGYPGTAAEVDMLYAQAEAHPLDGLPAVMTANDVLAIQGLVRAVELSRDLAAYLVAIVEKTRDDIRLKLGVSPRASLMLFQASKAAAFVAGRDYVLPDDIQQMARHVLPHRVMLTSKSKYDGSTKAGIIEALLAEIPVPV